MNANIPPEIYKQMQDAFRARANYEISQTKRYINSLNGSRKKYLEIEKRALLKTKKKMAELNLLDEKATKYIDLFDIYYKSYLAKEKAFNAININRTGVFVNV